MKKATIICGAPCNNYDFVKSHICDDTFIIACDGGSTIAKSIGVKINLAVGDFDSSTPPDDCEVITLPCEKDCTDTFFACMKAIELGFDTVDIFCAVGGRNDHTYANYLCLNYLNENCVDAKIIDESNCVFIKTKAYSITKNEYKYLSLFAFAGDVKALTLKGVKYPLNKYHLSQNDSLCISNEIIEDKADIAFESGRLLIFLSKD